MLETGGYHDDRDFDGLELSAYQRLYLNGGPFPTAEGQVSIVAGTGVGGGTVINWTNCLRTYDHVRAEWASEHGLSDLAESELRRAPRRGLRAARRQRRLLATSTARTSACSEACEKLGYDFRPITRNADPRALRARASAAYMGFGDQSGSKQSTAKTYLVDAQARRRRDPRRLPRRADPGRGRARRRGRGACGRDPAAARPNGAGATTR